MPVNKFSGLLLLGICMVPFALGLHGPFMLDDESNLNLLHAATGTLKEILYAISHNDSGLLRRPISNLSFLLNYYWVGHTPFDYKLINLIIHWLNAYVLWRLAIHIIKFLYPDHKPSTREACGLFIAVLWAAHPIQVSTVLYAVQRMAELSALFTMLSLLIFLRLMERPISANFSIRTTILGVAAVWAIFILALLSKENAALFPCYLLVIYLATTDEMRQGISKDTGKKIAFALCCWIPLVLGCAGFFIKFSWFAGGYAMRDFTLSERLLTEPSIVFRYLGTILIPNIKHMGLYLDDMQIHQMNDLSSWLVLSLILAMPIAAYLMRKKAPALAFAVLWFLAAHLMESTVIPLELAFEHRNYLALFGPVFAIGYYVFIYLSEQKIHILRLAAIVPIAVLCAGTAVRAHQWSDSILFIQQEAENHPFSPRAQNEIINLDIAAGNLEKVVAGVEKVQGLKPDAFWPMTLDFNLACGIPNYPVQWKKMEDQVRKRPSDIGIPGMLLFDTEGLIKPSCRYLDADRFDAFLGVIATIYQEYKMFDKTEKMYVLRSHIADFKKEPKLAIEFLDTAAQVNPYGLLAIHELAYYALNIDDLDVAAAAINQLESRVHAYAPASQYDVDELRGYLAQAQREKAAADTKSRPNN